MIVLRNYSSNLALHLTAIPLCSISAGELIVLCKMKKRAKKIYQGFAVLISLALIATGLSPILSKGEMFYSNWRGALVFAPISVIAGLFLLYLVIFKWDKMLKMK